MRDVGLIALLVLFLVSALSHGWATRRLLKLDKLRLEKEPPPGAQLPGGLSNMTQRVGLKLAPSNEVLRSFCERHGVGGDYQSAQRWLYGSIAVGFVSLVALSKLVVAPS